MQKKPILVTWKGNATHAEMVKMQERMNSGPLKKYHEGNIHVIKTPEDGKCIETQIKLASKLEVPDPRTMVIYTTSPFIIEGFNKYYEFERVYLFDERGDFKRITLSELFEDFTSSLLELLQ